jgi:hypothetical protein
MAAELERAAAENRRADAVELFMTKVMQMPGPAFDQVRKSPMFGGLQHLAHTLSYDVLITSRGPARLDDAATVRAPVLMMSGGASPPWMRDAIQTFARTIPNARHRTLEGQTHAVDIKVLASALEAFLSDS